MNGRCRSAAHRVDGDVVVGADGELRADIGAEHEGDAKDSPRDSSLERPPFRARLVTFRHSTYSISFIILDRFAQSA